MVPRAGRKQAVARASGNPRLASHPRAVLPERRALLAGDQRERKALLARDQRERKAPQRRARQRRAHRSAHLHAVRPLERRCHFRLASQSLAPHRVSPSAQSPLRKELAASQLASLNRPSPAPSRFSTQRKNSFRNTPELTGDGLRDQAVAHSGIVESYPALH